MNTRSVTPRFLASSALSLFGNSVAGIVLPLVLLARTGDPLAAGSLALICAIPQMLAGLLGGALLDRVNRRLVSIVSDFISAASVALLPLVDMIWGLNFGWFVALGLLGSVGDIPGMTARESLLPAVCARDGVDMQKFLGLSQSLDAIVTIAGPALAAFLIGFGGDINALWVTAGLSCAAALVTITLPRSVGAISASTTEAEHETSSPDAKKQHSAKSSFLSATWSSLADGVRVLFKNDAILRTSTLLTFGLVMVLGGFQGLVLPVYFTETGHPELLGYVLSVLSGGMLVGSLTYAALAERMRKRTWYVVSLIGTVAGIALIGLLPTYALMLLGAFLLGIAAGPASALLGFFAYDRIPHEKRGSALGTQNALLLAAAPLTMFAASLIVSKAGTATAAFVLVAGWVVVTLAALSAPAMRNLDEQVPKSNETGSLTTPAQAPESIQ